MLFLPCISAGRWLPGAELDLGDSAPSALPLSIPCVSLKHRGRKPRAYGPAHGCGTCRRPPRYRDSWITNCACGAAPNPSAPVVLVRFVGDGA